MTPTPAVAQPVDLGSRPVISSAVIGQSLVADASERVKRGQREFHIDCAHGDDGDLAQSPATAWKTFAPLADLRLMSGDEILIATGCEYEPPLVIRGTAEAVGGAAITVGPYRDSGGPVEIKATQANLAATVLAPDPIQLVMVSIESAVVNIANINTTVAGVCPLLGQLPEIIVGFELGAGTNGSTLSNVSAVGGSYGVTIARAVPDGEEPLTTNVKVEGSEFKNNWLVKTVDGVVAGGASGVHLYRTAGNTIVDNAFEGSSSPCGGDSANANAIVLFGATGNEIRENTIAGYSVGAKLQSAANDNRFTENRFLQNRIGIDIEAIGGAISGTVITRNSAFTTDPGVDLGPSRFVEAQFARVEGSPDLVVNEPNVLSNNTAVILDQTGSNHEAKAKTVSIGWCPVKGERPGSDDRCKATTKVFVIENNYFVSDQWVTDLYPRRQTADVVEARGNVFVGHDNGGNRYMSDNYFTYNLDQLALEPGNDLNCRSDVGSIAEHRGVRPVGAEFIGAERCRPAR